MGGDFFNGWPEDGEPVPERIVMSDLDAPTGIIHGCLIGLITIMVVLLALCLIANAVQVDEHSSRMSESISQRV